MAFHPNGNDPLPIDDVPYRIAEHPAARGIPYGQEGRAATVYALYTESDRRALKVFKPRFRVPSLVGLARRLDQYSVLPGLQVCRRTVLVPQYHASLLRQHPDLLYAVLMPWVNGPTWMEVLLDLRGISPEQSLQLALSLADVLGRMEQMGLAHCDLSASNIIISALASPPVEAATPLSLVDVEGLYGPGLDRPEVIPGGSPGYAHNRAPQGLWDSTADRFAGAVLLAEMLGWCDTRLRASAWGESYFAPEEMQRSSPRYTLLHNVLAERWGSGAAALFERAWRSATLDECPTFDEWLIGLPDTVPATNIPSTSAQDAAQFAPQTSIEADHATRSLMEDARKLSAEGKRLEAIAAYREALSLAPPGSALAEELSFIIDGLTHQPIPSPLPAPAPYQRPTEQQQPQPQPESSEPAPLPSYKPPANPEPQPSYQSFSPPPSPPPVQSQQPAQMYVQPQQVQPQAQPAQMQNFEAQPLQQQGWGGPPPPSQFQQTSVPFQQSPPPPRQPVVPAGTGTAAPTAPSRRFNVIWLLAGLFVLLVASAAIGFLIISRQDTPIIAAGEHTATPTAVARVPSPTSAASQVDPTTAPQPTATSPAVALAPTNTPEPPPPTEAPKPTPTVPTLCFKGGSLCVAGKFLDMWKTLGGKDEGSPGDAGLPLASAETVNGVLTQRFERYTMEYRPEKAPFDVQFANLGLQRYKAVFGHDPAPVKPIPGCRFFEQTGHNMCEGFYPFWQTHGPSLGIKGDQEAISLLLYGYPISDAGDEVINGVTMTVQWFEKARFEFRPDDPKNPVQLGLLGAELSK